MSGLSEHAARSERAHAERITPGSIAEAFGLDLADLGPIPIRRFTSADMPSPVPPVVGPSATLLGIAKDYGIPYSVLAAQRDAMAREAAKRLELERAVAAIAEAAPGMIRRGFPLHGMGD